jgi:drug/metabolite transporter (DMT)-like permease
MKTAPTGRIWAGLVFLYIAWGSTYLAIRFVVEAVPPVLASGLRNLLAGVILFTVAKLNAPQLRPTRRAWLVSALAGTLMLTVGNGGVTIAARWVPSGYASLFSALVPAWLVLIQLVDGIRPSRGVLLGLVLGLVGVGLLMNLDQLALTGQERYFGWGIFALLVATVGWSAGVITAQKGALSYPTALIAGMQMLCGGGLSILLSGTLGEWQEFNPALLTFKPVASFTYLLVVGSLAAFTVFGWLSKVAPPTLVATYTYVNPLVAILLGNLFAGEKLDLSMLLAAGVIVAAVVLITMGKKPEPRAEVVAGEQ